MDEIAVGDEVLSRDEDNPEGPLEWKNVEDVFQRFGFVVQLRVGGRVIKTTVEHPFCVRDKGWLPAGELQRGDLLCSHEGQWLAVEEIVGSGDYGKLYNLRVADYHTYFVGAEGWGFSVWAHNTCGIYKFKSSNRLTYVGQSANIMQRLLQHLKSGKLKPADIGSVLIKEVLGDKTAREIAEQVCINGLGGVKKLRNIRNPIGKSRSYLLP